MSYFISYFIFFFFLLFLYFFFFLFFFFFFSSRRRHTRFDCDWSSDMCSSDLEEEYGQTVSTYTIGRAIASLPDGGWPIKKVTDSLRARRGGEGSVAVAGRSEERRVGKECRSRGSSDHERKKREESGER